MNWIHGLIVALIALGYAVILERRLAALKKTVKSNWDEVTDHDRRIAKLETGK